MRLPEYVQIKEAAALLGVAQNTLRNWEQAGKITVYRHPMNGYRLYKKVDLQRLLASIETSAVSYQRDVRVHNETSST